MEIYFQVCIIYLLGCPYVVMGGLMFFQLSKTRQQTKAKVGEEGQLLHGSY